MIGTQPPTHGAGVVPGTEVVVSGFCIAFFAGRTRHRRPAGPFRQVRPHLCHTKKNIPRRAIPARATAATWLVGRGTAFTILEIDPSAAARATISATNSRSMKYFAPVGLGPSREPWIPGQWLSKIKWSNSNTKQTTANRQNPKSANEKAIDLSLRSVLLPVRPQASVDFPIISELRQHEGLPEAQAPVCT